MNRILYTSFLLGAGFTCIKAQSSTPPKNEPWELIELSTDPFETKDLSAQYPKLVKKLEIKWNKWAERSNVFPLENKPWSERIRYYIERNPEQNGKE